MALFVVLAAYLVSRVALELGRYSAGAPLDTTAPPDAYGYMGCIFVGTAVASLLVTRDTQHSTRTGFLAVVGMATGLALDFALPFMPLTLLTYLDLMAFPALAWSGLTGLAVGWVAGRYMIHRKAWVLSLIILAWAITGMLLMIVPVDKWLVQSAG